MYSNVNQSSNAFRLALLDVKVISWSDCHSMESLLKDGVCVATSTEWIVKKLLMLLANLPEEKRFEQTRFS